MGTKSDHGNSSTCCVDNSLEEGHGRARNLVVEAPCDKKDNGETGNQGTCISLFVWKHEGDQRNQSCCKKIGNFGYVGESRRYLEACCSIL